jgi:type IX secretion system PorP/SprF family membrane protein
MLTTAQVVYGQLNNPLSQYNQLPYLQNAAFSGITDYTNIKVGFKKQWAKFNGSPRSYLLGMDHVFGGNLNSSHAYNEVETKPSQKSIKVGVSGYLIENNYKSIQDTHLGLSVAIHVPISSRYYLSLGLSPNYNRLKSKTDELTVRDTQDPFYQGLLADNGVLNYFNLDAGMILYSDQLYIGYSIQRLARTRFNSDIPEDENSNMRHAVVAGYTIKLNNYWEFQPGILIRYESVLKDIYNVSLKFRYDTKLLAGMAFSPGESISILTGYQLNNYFAIHYSYDISIGKTSSVSQGSHEIIIGITPFNKTGKKSAFW